MDQIILSAPIINLLAPFFAAFIACGVGIWNRKIAQPIAIIALIVSLLSSLQTLVKVMTSGAFVYSMGGWSPPFGIAFGIDPLNALVVVLIQFVALLTVMHSGGLIKRELGAKRHLYYALFLLFVTGITGITQTADAFNLYVLIEVASLTSYALIAVGEKRSVHSALNYLFMGSIGATLYLLGVGYLYIKTGTLNMLDIHSVLISEGLFTTPTVQVAAIMIFVGLWLKMAFFPFHGWLPNAYTWSPISSASLMAPLMTKVMIYVMIRMMLVVFGLEHVFMDFPWAKVVPYLAVVAILYGSFMALSQNNLRRMITYIVVAEVGYMVGAAWLGNEQGILGAFFHIISDSLMTLCLFLAVGSMLFKHGVRTITDLEHAFSKMPITMGFFAVGALSMIGIPPTCGFFSKWYLVGGGIAAGNWIYVVALLLSSFVNAVIFFRIFEIAYFGKNPKSADSNADHHSTDVPQAIRREEAPLGMLIPAGLTALSIILLGIFNQKIIEMIQLTLSSINKGGLL